MPIANCTRANAVTLAIFELLPRRTGFSIVQKQIGTSTQSVAGRFVFVEDTGKTERGPAAAAAEKTQPAGGGYPCCDRGRPATGHDRRTAKTAGETAVGNRAAEGPATAAGVGEGDAGDGAGAARRPAPESAARGGDAGAGPGGPGGGSRRGQSGRPSAPDGDESAGQTGQMGGGPGAAPAGGTGGGPEETRSRGEDAPGTDGTETRAVVRGQGKSAAEAGGRMPAAGRAGRLAGER